MSDRATSNVLFYLMKGEPCTCRVFCTLVPEAPTMCFMQQGVKFTLDLTQIT